MDDAQQTRAEDDPMATDSHNDAPMQQNATGRNNEKRESRSIGRKAGGQSKLKPNRSAFDAACCVRRTAVDALAALRSVQRRRGGHVCPPLGGVVKSAADREGVTPPCPRPAG